MISRSLLLALLFGVELFSLAPAESSPVRRIAIRVPESFSRAQVFEPYASFARRRGVELDIGLENKEVPSGWEVVRMGALPVSDHFRRLLDRFPLRLKESGFEFDGRTYPAPEDGIALSDPARPEQTLILANSREAAVGLLAWGLRRKALPGGYLVISGALSKQGRFERSGTALTIDRPSDRDEIGEKESFYQSLKTDRRGGVLWRFRESEREAFTKWQPVLQGFLRREGQPTGLTIVLFPDPATKGRYTGSSRPADLEEKLQVNLDVSAPAEPDLISPVLAAAALSAANPRLLSRPTIRLAAGARALGLWWGRPVRSFAAFLYQAQVEPSVEEAVSSSESDLSPVFAVGAVSSWLEAGARSEGEAAVQRALSGSDAELVAALSRWRKLAIREASPPPRRRPMPHPFLRGVSYAMTNAIAASYASPRSLETLRRLQQMSVNSISVIPYAFSRHADAPRISFVHRSPSGETDEGTVRAVTDARALEMTAMVKPQIWVGEGAFVGEIVMRSAEDWRRWFDAYRRFIVHHAVVAEASRAELFCVGTELVKAQVREKEWRQTIAAIRLATGAPLTYASNWASGAAEVPFWDALDAVGVNFYDPLSKDPGASDTGLEEGVRRATRPLALLARKSGKPVLFTEAGYPPVRAAWLAPHDENTGRPPAPEDAARAVAAVFRALQAETWWEGVYWWKAFSDGHAANPGNRDFNVLGTPCEKVIAEGFARLARERSR